jgi:shikimate kinase/3-dehydroquinate synthase
MGSGKSSVGRRLAARLGVPFVDLDACVGDVPSVFAREGEAGFRARERDALAKAVTAPCGVLALGGGAALTEEARAHLAGWRVAVLHAPVQVLRARVAGDPSRPLVDELETLTASRASAYARTGVPVDTDGRSIDEVVDGVMLALGCVDPGEPPARWVLGSADEAPVVATEGLDALGSWMRRAGLRSARAVLVSDAHVDAAWGDPAEGALRGGGYDVARIVLTPGEAHKTVEAWADLVSRLVDAGVARDTPIVALGGGVVGDLAGFAAATVLRGVPLVQVPTSLLAMVDASVGGKTAVNLAQGRNLVGAFHPARLVLAPMATLSTLPEPEYRSGLGEVVKHALLAGEDALARCERAADALRARDPGATAAAVREAVTFKLRVVAADPVERGQRVILNLGHTVAHALETAAGHGALRHGEAVAIGLAAMLRWASARGRCAPSLPPRVEALLRGLGLPTWAPPALDPARVRAAVGMDKKRERGRIRLVVPRAPGSVEVLDAEPGDLDDLVRNAFTTTPLPAEMP